MSMTRVEPAGADGTQRVEQGPTPAPDVGVPWRTVLPLAVVLAFADGFWIISLRGAVGALERTESPSDLGARDHPHRAALRPRRARRSHLGHVPGGWRSTCGALMAGRTTPSKPPPLRRPTAAASMSATFT